MDAHRGLMTVLVILLVRPSMAEAPKLAGGAIAMPIWENTSFDKLIASYTEAIRLNPKDAEAYKGRAFAYGEKDKHLMSSRTKKADLAEHPNAFYLFG